MLRKGQFIVILEFLNTEELQEIQKVNHEFYLDIVPSVYIKNRKIPRFKIYPSDYITGVIE